MNHAVGCSVYTTEEAADAEIKRIYDRWKTNAVVWKVHGWGGRS